MLTLDLFAPAPPTPRFRCIVTDPPWQERGGGKIKRGADRHYPLLNVDDIVAVHERYFREVGGPDPSGCLLWLWVTSNFLVEGLDVMRRLGFQYVTQLVWVKPTVGLGQRTRQRHEPLLLGRMGQVPVPAPPDRPDSVIPADEVDVDDVIEAPRGRHSQKPAEAFARIERACAGPRLEVFARAARDGWTVVGNEAPT